MNFERNIRAIAMSNVHMTLNEAIILADTMVIASRPVPKRTYVPNLRHHAGLVEFARRCPEVMKNLPDKKIQAIKALRGEIAKVEGSLGWAYSLRSCKDAIDTICPSQYS